MRRDRDGLAGRGGRGARPKRVVFVSNTDIFFLQYRLPVALSEQRRGAEVVVIAPEGGHGREIERAGFRFIALPLSRRGVNPWREMKTVLFLARVYRKLRPDLVHHLTIKPVLYGSFAARLSGTKPAIVNAVTGLGFVFSERGSSSFLRSLVQTLYRGVLHRPSTMTIFENRDDLQDFITRGLVAEPRAVLLPGLGVDCELFTPSPEPRGGVPLVILPCRMLWNKGVGEFVRAAELLQARGVTARFALVGVPDPGNPGCIEVEQLRAWQQRGAVEWWGHRSDMPRVFAESHLVAFPTCYREGVPRALLEAAASGRPIVATSMPGCTEIVRPGVNGSLVEPGDAEGLADAIEELLRDPALRARYGASGREIVEREFSKTTVVEKMLQLHEEALSADTTAELPSQHRRGVGVTAPGV